MAEHLFDEMKRYVGFGADDEALLREAGAELAPHFAEIVDAFYERLAAHAAAVAVVERYSSIDRLKKTLRAWLERFFAGPWDRAYYEERARIGRRHVEIGLAHHYPTAAMHVIRRHMTDRLFEGPGPIEIRKARIDAVHKLVDLELVILMHTYFEDFVVAHERSERLQTYGLLTSMIAHELRNPLAVMDTSLYLLREQVPEASDGRRHLDKIQAQVRRSNRLIRSLLDLVRDRPPRVRRVRPADVVGRAVEAIREERGVRVVPVVASELPAIDVDTDQVLQILSNLLSNAADAAGPDGAIRLEAETDGDRVRFVVSDDGPGIAPEIEARLFEPLVTTKLHGVGLGLALCRKLATAHGGRLALGPPRLAGASFVLELPARA